MRWRVAPPVILLLAAAIATGCGDGGDGDSSTTSAVPTSSLTKAELVRKADAICRKREKELAEQLAAFTRIVPDQRLTKPQEQQFVADDQLPSLEDQVRELAKLGVPAGDDGQLEAILQGVREAVAEGREDPATILESTSEPLATAADLAGRYGFEVCFGRY